MEAILKDKISNVGGLWAIDGKFIINNLGQTGIRLYSKKNKDIITVSDNHRFVGGTDFLFCTRQFGKVVEILDYSGQILDRIEQITHPSKVKFYNNSFYFRGRDSNNIKRWYRFDIKNKRLEVILSNLKSDWAFIRESCIVVFSKSHLTLLAWNYNQAGKIKFELSKNEDLNLKSDVPSAYKYIDIGDDKLLITYKWEQSMLVDVKEEKILFNKSMGFLNLDPDNESMAFCDQLSKTIYSYSFEGHLLESFSVKEIEAIDVVKFNLTLKYLNGHLLVSTSDPNLLLIDKSGAVVQKYTLPEELRSRLNHPPNMFLAGGDLLGFRGGDSAYSPFVIYELLW